MYQKKELEHNLFVKCQLFHKRIAYLHYLKEFKCSIVIRCLPQNYLNIFGA